MKKILKKLKLCGRLRKSFCLRKILSPKQSESNHKTLGLNRSISISDTLRPHNTLQLRKSISYALSTIITFSALTSPALEFTGACAPAEDTLVIGASGDLLLHDTLQIKAYARAEGFVSLWKALLPRMQSVDMMYTNLEGATAEGVNYSYNKNTGYVFYQTRDPGAVYHSKGVYSAYPMFNYHNSLIDDLIASSVDVVSTANNHSLDRGALGVAKTIEALEDKGLEYTGTRINPKAPWHTIVERNGFRVAWLACTYGTNIIEARNATVLRCFGDNTVENVVKALSKQKDIDAVIVTPHWGVEYQTKPNAQQVTFAKRWLEAGALAVLGAHPHILQPIEKHFTKDKRETLIAYSLANFVSAQTGASLYSALLHVGLSRKQGKVWINGAKYTPLEMITPLRDPRLSIVQQPTSAAGQFIRSLLGSDGWIGAEQTDLRPNRKCFGNN